MDQTEDTPEHNMNRETPYNKSFAFARRVLTATLVVAIVVLLLLFAWYAADLLMLVFAGVLVSILLRAFSSFVREKTGIGRGLSLALVSLVLLAVIAAAGWLIAARIGTQASELQQQIPQAVESVSNYITQYDWARNAVENLPSAAEWFAGNSGNLVTRFTGLASTTFGGLVNVLLVVVVGLYLASQPKLYSGGIERLLPFAYRTRTGEVLGVLDEALRRWLVGRVVLMTLNGVLTGIGLWLLGVPLALTLGLLCGILNFIPNFGPWIAAVPAVLLAFLQSPQQALYVAILYLALQSLDGYVFTPLVDRKSVELPPVVTISAQVLLGLAFGFIGLLLASPFAAVAVLLVKMLYIEDVLGDSIMKESSIAAAENDKKSD